MKLLPGKGCQASAFLIVAPNWLYTLVSNMTAHIIRVLRMATLKVSNVSCNRRKTVRGDASDHKLGIVINGCRRRT